MFQYVSWSAPLRRTGTIDNEEINNDNDPETNNDNDYKPLSSYTISSCMEIVVFFIVDS
jgi:hypothetical protein